MLVDANLLLYAVNAEERKHDAAKTWLSEQLNGARRVGLPWQSLAAFLRVSTHPRALPRPVSPTTAWRIVTKWIASPAAWIPSPGDDHARILDELFADGGVAGNLVTDAFLAALAIEHGLTVFSADTDFARFPGLRWENPLA